MENKTIKKLLLILSIISIFILIIFAVKNNPKEISLEKLNNLTINDEGKSIKTTGIIEKSNYQSNLIAINLKNSTIQFILFSKKFIYFEKDVKVGLTGKIEFYNNHPQILVDRLRILS